MSADEALAKALHDWTMTPKPLTPEGMVAIVRAAGWAPLTEVEEALRAEGAKRTPAGGWSADETPCWNDAADLVASLGRTNGDGATSSEGMDASPDPTPESLARIMAASPDVTGELLRRVQRAVRYLDYMLGDTPERPDNPLSPGVEFSLRAIRASLIEPDPPLPPADLVASLGRKTDG